MVQFSINLGVLQRAALGGMRSNVMTKRPIARVGLHRESNLRGECGYDIGCGVELPIG